jgi:hypothetical protein
MIKGRLKTKLKSLFKRRHGTQHNDIQHNVTQQNKTQHNDTQHNDTQHNGRVLLCCVVYADFVYNECRKLALYAECQYVECRYTECCGAI